MAWSGPANLKVFFNENFWAFCLFEVWNRNFNSCFSLFFVSECLLLEWLCVCVYVYWEIFIKTRKSGWLIIEKQMLCFFFLANFWCMYKNNLAWDESVNRCEKIISCRCKRERKRWWVLEPLVWFFG